MTGKIVKFYAKNAAENPDAVLEQAVGCYDDVLIIGWDKEGYLDPRANLNLTSAQVLWLIEVFKKNLLNGVYDK